MHNTRCVLTIAGSDSCGGAGIQADLKTFALQGVEGASVLTAITAQNTLGVTAVQALSPELVGAQLAAVLDDLPIAAAKTGMLANSAIVHVLADKLDRRREIKLVVDPVMVATSGARLLDPEAERDLTRRLLPLATLVTPNLPEAAALAQMDENTAPEKLAEQILGMGCQAVLVKGGHASAAEVVDVLVSGTGVHRFSHCRVDRRVHGTGCALSAAITAGLGRGLALEAAVGQAIAWLQDMLSRTWQPLKGELAMLPFGQGERMNGCRG